MKRAKQMGNDSQMQGKPNITVGCLFHDNLYTIEEVAKRLRIGNSTLRRLIYQGQIKAIRIGGRILLPEKFIEEFMVSSVIKPAVNVVEYQKPLKYRLPDEVLNSKHLKGVWS